MKVSGVMSKVKAFQMLMSGSEYYDQGAGNVVCVVIKERSLGSCNSCNVWRCDQADQCGDGQVSSIV